MEIYKGARGKNVKIYESSYFVDEKVIRLEKIRFTEQELNNGEHDATIEIKFMMRNHYKMENQEICYVETTLTSLKEFSGQQDKKLALIDSKGKKVSELRVHTCNIQNLPKFSHYLMDKYSFGLICALDFTISNGSQNTPTSLHYKSDTNQYTTALKAVGDILNQYDNDKKYPVFGFGGIPEFMS